MLKKLYVLLLVSVFLCGCKKEAEYEIPEETDWEEEDEYDFPVLDVDAYFEGSIDTDGDYTIKGRLKGSLLATGTVLVDETGIVECDSIVAGDVIVKGHITGTVKAVHEIRVDPTGIIIGETFCKNLVVNGGSVFHAKSGMAEPKKRERPR
jgi:cytoskeletal protein CcmA (bactofilin family)